MTFEEFHNGIRVLHSIDSHELGDPPWWRRFRDDPVRFFIKADDETAAAIWNAMQIRSAVNAVSPIGAVDVLARVDVAPGWKPRDG